MNISAVFIRRPIGTTLLGVALLLAGWLGFTSLPVSSLPEVDFPTIQVTTRLPGAGPETTAPLITTPLERQLGQITGLTLMTSTSSYGISTITMQFSLDRNIDAVGQDVQAAINAAAGSLPANLPYPPIYRKVNPADQPILVLALRSDTQSIFAVHDAADTIMAQKLSEVAGVGAVTVQGGQRPAIRVQINPLQLAGVGLSLEDVRTALVRASVNQPKGSLDGKEQAYTIGADDQLLAADAFADVILAYRNAAAIRLRDVGTAVQGPEDATVGAWQDGRPAVIVDVQRQPGANIIQTVDRIKEVLPQLRAALPADVQLSVLSDRTAAIRAGIADVEFTLLLTTGLVVMVNLLFLRSFWAIVVPSVALPLTMVGTFGAMYLAGFSLDNLSLMALTIGTGFIIDDAIIMVENIVRHIETGEAPLSAAYNGARQIGFTIVSLTLSITAVFIPLLFMGGIVGRLFREFALTLTIATFISAIISLTLTPMMCGWLLRGKAGTRQPFLLRWSEAGFDAVLGLYRITLLWVLRHRTATLLVGVLSLACAVVLYVVIPKGLLPTQDTGVILATTDADPGVSFAAMTRLQASAAAIARADPDVAAVASFVGVGTLNATPNSGRITILLRPAAEGRASAEAVIARLRRALARADGLTVYLQAARDVQIGTRASRTQYQYILVGADESALMAWAQRLLRRLLLAPELRNVATDQQAGGLTASLVLDRDQSGRLGILPQTIDDVLYDAFGQRQISTIYTQQNQYRVVLEVTPEFRGDPSDLARLHVPIPRGGQVPLGSITTLRRGTAPLAITHQGLFPSVTLSFDTRPGSSLEDAVRAVHAAEAAIEMPDTVTGSFAGEAAEFQASLVGESWLILAAIVSVYVVLGVLYESAIHPITILSTLPSAGIGALVALIVTGNELSMIAIIAVLLLIGIVKKNAIMMIDFALDAQRGGLPPREAIYEACLKRFRPIMMTTVAALLGAIPLALGTGTGSEFRRPLGIAIVGGLLVSQLLTLYTTPVVYLALDSLRWRSRVPRSAPWLVDR